MHFYHPDAIGSWPARRNSHVVIDDGRNYLLMHQRQFDAISIDPPSPIYSARSGQPLQPGILQTLHSPPPSQRRRLPLGSASRYDIRFESGPAHFLRPLSPMSPFGPDPTPVSCSSARSQPSQLTSKARAAGFCRSGDRHQPDQWDNSCDSPEKVLSLQVCDRDALSWSSPATAQ